MRHSDAETMKPTHAHTWRWGVMGTMSWLVAPRRGLGEDIMTLTNNFMLKINMKKKNINYENALHNTVLAKIR